MLQTPSVKTEMIKEKLLFLRRWFENPLSLGAIAPSSKALAQATARITLDTPLEEDEYILELGAGTGSFTRALLKMGLPPKKLICVEMDPKLYEYLKLRFPSVQVICGDASQLSQLLPDNMRKKVSTVVSGIPLLPLPRSVCQKIIDGSFGILKEGGQFLQFTYSPFSPIRSREYALEKCRMKTVFWNLPPATIWSYRRV